MSVLQLFAGLLLDGILASLITGLVCYFLLQASRRLFPQCNAAAIFFLCNFCLLLTTIAFLRPFAGQLFNHNPQILLESPLTAAAQGVQIMQPPASYAADRTGANSGGSGNFFADCRAAVWQHANLIGAIYICGLTFFLARLIAGCLHMRRLRLRGLSAPNKLWQAQMDAVLGNLNMGHRVLLRFSSLVTAPCIIGRAKAIILIPIALATRLTPAQAEAVLLHELAHHRQYHYYINIAVQAMTALQFFNPFTWLLLRAGNRYREYACDALAGSYSRQVELAESLVIIAEQHSAARSLLVLSLHSAKSQLFHRIQNLLLMKPSTVPSRVSLIVGAIAMIVACCCYGSLRALPSAKSEAQPDTLAVISRQLQADTNMNFLIVEALRDSLLPFNTPYRIEYRPGSILINGTEAPEPHQSKYLALIREYKRRAGPDESRYTWSIETDWGLTLDQVLNPASKFRKSVFRPLEFGSRRTATPALPTAGPSAPAKPQASVSRSGANNELYETMIADGLIRRYEPIHVVYEDGTLAVNNQPLKASLRRKYKALLKDDMDFAGATAGKPAKYSVYAEGVMAPPIRNGNSLIQFPRQRQMKPYIYANPSLPSGLVLSPYDLLSGPIAADKLADTSYVVHVVYTAKGIFINDKIVEDAQYDKYEQLLNEGFGYSRPRLEDDKLDITF
jgi:beta-lactamase regulating signal transducer with metallopeptidase domain